MMDPEGAWTTAFTHCTDKYNRRVQFQRVSMGDQNASAVWSRVAETIFKPVLDTGNAALLMDDVVGGVHTADELINMARAIARACLQHNLRLNPEKCQFGLSRMAALGYVFDRDGRHLHPGRVAAVMDMPAPTNPKEVGTFLGHTEFWASHIPGYVFLARPLSRLKRKGAEWTWRPDVEARAWNLLRDAVCSDPVVRGFNPEHDVYVYTDACNTGLGGCLTQLDPSDGRKYLVESWGRTLKPAETRYHMTELECLAVRDALKKWSQYFIKDRFYLCTDSRNVTW